MAIAADEDVGLRLLPPPDPRRPVPWRTIVASVFVVVLTYAAYLLLKELARLVAWLVVAGFFTIILSPAVDFLQVRAKLRRGVAVGVVFVVGLGLFGGMLYIFIRPAAEQVNTFVDELPQQVRDAREGRGAIGRLVERYDLDEYLDRNEDRIQETLSGAGTPALGVARSVFNTVLAFVTILVLTVLMLMRGPQLSQGALSLIGSRHRDRVRVVSADAARAVSGYMIGNLLISLIAGTATFIMLTILGVPYAGVIALFVGFADLIPLVGATLGAIPTIGLAFLHSTTAGIVATIFYIVYQQFENHVLQVTIMSRTVAVNPLVVLVSVLAGVELFGFLGALLAIPIAGIIQVVVRDLYDGRQGQFTTEPTVGADETPIGDEPAEIVHPE